MKGPIVDIPARIRARLIDLQHHFGSGIALSKAVGVYPTYFSKAIRGDQTKMDKGMLERLETTLKTFDPGPRTGVSLNRRPRPRRVAAAQSTPETAAVVVAEPIRSIKKKKRKYTKRTPAALAPVQIIHTNGNGREQERSVVLMGILDGMAIQAEIMRRTVTEFINRIPEVNHGTTR